jgi:hypothetical protein
MDPDPALFVSGFENAKTLRSHKTVEIKDFRNRSCLLIEGFGSVQIITDPDPGGPKLTYTDPKYCFFSLFIMGTFTVIPCHLIGNLIPFVKVAINERFVCNTL